MLDPKKDWQIKKAIQDFFTFQGIISGEWRMSGDPVKLSANGVVGLPEVYVVQLVVENVYITEMVAFWWNEYQEPTIFLQAGTIVSYIRKIVAQAVVDHEKDHPHF